MPPILSFVGRSGSGKTTLIEKLITELTRRGRRIGVIKHALHKIEFDKKGKDSWRHRSAGAEAVMIASPDAISFLKMPAIRILIRWGRISREWIW